MNTRPHTPRAASAAVAALVLMAMGGCSHYHIGIPIVPGLSLGLGASKDGNYSVGLNTGFGPLGAGVAVNNGGAVTGSAGVGVGVGVGPVGTGIGVSKGMVLYDPKAAPGTGPVVLPATASANVMATAVPLTAATPVAAVTPVRITYRNPAVAAAAASSTASSSRELGTPANPIAP